MTEPKMVYPEGVEQNDEGTTHYPPPRLEQPKSECKCLDCNLPELESDCEPEQPNTELLIVKTIQGLISAANRELGELDELTNNRKVIIRQVLDDIDILQRGPLFELQKAFE